MPEQRLDLPAQPLVTLAGRAKKTPLVRAQGAPRPAHSTRVRSRDPVPANSDASGQRFNLGRVDSE